MNLEFMFLSELLPLVAGTGIKEQKSYSVTFSGADSVLHESEDLFSLIEAHEVKICYL